MSTQQKDNFEALYEVAQSINSILDTNELIYTVLEIAMKHLSAERGFILLASPFAPTEYEVCRAINFGEKEAGTFAASSSVVTQVLSSGEPILTFDAMSDERFESSTSIMAQKILSIICLPLRIREKIIGAVYLDSTRSRKMFTEDSLKFLSIFSNLSAIAIENAKQFNELKNENERLRNNVGSINLFKGVIGKSKKWNDVLDIVHRVLDVDVAVLISGESGTGKELIARAIHDNGARKTNPFVGINCSAIPSELLESELFGHKKGSFTGANTDKKGLFEVADSGTIFLDEIADLPLMLQSKLLRVLQEKEIRRVGDTISKKIDVRVIAATNKDIQAEVKAGRFREDLFFRLNVVSLRLPALRERKEDIPTLAEFFFEKAIAAHKRSLQGIHPDAMSALVHSQWQGNVRELQNVIERAVVLCKGNVIQKEDIIGTTVEASFNSQGMTLEQFERQLIEATLAEMGGNRTRTAEKLGVSLRWLQYRIKEWGIE